MTSVNNAILKQLETHRIDAQNQSINVMLMYSGGADSVSLAKSILEATNHKLVLHHVVINNPEKRDQFQLNVIEKQLKYLRTNYRDFEFIKTSFEMNLNKRAGIIDMSVALFMAGSACGALGRRFSVIYTGHLHATPVSHFMEAGSVLNSLFINRRFKPVWLYPLRYLNRSTSKEVVYKNIGPEVLNLTVSCRRPTVDGENYISCLQCHACKTRSITVKKLGWDVALVK